MGHCNPHILGHFLLILPLLAVRYVVILRLLILVGPLAPLVSPVSLVSPEFLEPFMLLLPLPLAPTHSVRCHFLPVDWKQLLRPMPRQTLLLLSV